MQCLEKGRNPFRAPTDADMGNINALKKALILQSLLYYAWIDL